MRVIWWRALALVGLVVAGGMGCGSDASRAWDADTATVGRDADFQADNNTHGADDANARAADAMDLHTTDDGAAIADAGLDVGDAGNVGLADDVEAAIADAGFDVDAADVALADDGAAAIADARFEAGEAHLPLSCDQARRQLAPCPSGDWYAFTNDQRCHHCTSSAEPGCSSLVRYTCESWGDGLCYRMCQSNSDCADPCFPYCRKLGLYNGTDQCGASSQSVCLKSDKDTCDPWIDQP